MDPRFPELNVMLAWLDSLTLKGGPVIDVTTHSLAGQLAEHLRHRVDRDDLATLDRRVRQASNARLRRIFAEDGAEEFDSVLSTATRILRRDASSEE